MLRSSPAYRPVFPLRRICHQAPAKCHIQGGAPVTRGVKKSQPLPSKQSLSLLGKQTRQWIFHMTW